MKDTIYFQHDFNAWQDFKIRQMRRSFGWEGYGWYWYIIEQMRNQSDSKLPIANLAEILADDLSSDDGRIREYLNLCVSLGLFKNEGGFIYSERLVRDVAYMHEKKERARQNGKTGGRPTGTKKPKENQDNNQEVKENKPTKKLNKKEEDTIQEETINKKQEDTTEDRSKYMNEDGMPICDMVQRRMFCEDSGKYVGIEVIPDHAIVTVQKPGQPEMNMARVSLTMGDWDYITKLRMP
jgi:hypothetical protein